MKLHNVRGIIWDLDGTLIDSFNQFEQLLTELVPETGHKMPSREHMIQHYHGTLEQTLTEVLGLQSDDEAHEVANRFTELQQDHYTRNVDALLFPDAVDLSQKAALAGITQLIVSNRAHANRGNASPRAIVAATKLADCIHEVLAGDEVEFRKPDKRAVTEWMNRHELEPEEIIVIGDQFVDGQLAINIGARAVLIKRNGDIPHLEKLENSKPEQILLVDTLHDIGL